MTTKQDYLFHTCVTKIFTFLLPESSLFLCSQLLTVHWLLVGK